MDPLIISSGINLLGTLFGRKKKPEAQGVDYVKLRNDAQAAGFNPLTALMAGGGAGYQREFSPDLSSGSFIAEAVARAADTWFNTGGLDSAAEQIRQSDRVAGLLERAETGKAPRPFGYALTEVQPFDEDRTSNSPSLPPRGNPLYPHNRESVVVLKPDGKPFRVDASIARRMDWQTGDLLTGGDWEELRGELAGGIEMGADYANGIWDNSSGDAQGVFDGRASPAPYYAPKPPKFGVPFGGFSNANRAKRDPNKWWWQQ